MQLTRYLLTLLLTVAVEWSVACLLGFRTKQFALAVILINLITHPALNYFILFLVYLNLDPGLGLVIVLEVAVALVEWRLLVYVFDRPRKKLFLLAVLANLASFITGLILFW
ncbi:MAG: hypothetical protein JXA89_06280 [Anaerolineae bacterium]|nr:hypothetical protein [Anaerolineae bacterium]